MRLSDGSETPPTESTRSRRQLLAAAGVGVTTTLAGCIGGDDDGDDDTTTGDTSGGLEIIESELIEPDVGNWEVEGVVENSGESVDFVGVATRLLDPSGESIGASWSDLEEGLDAGEMWEFTLLTGRTHEDNVDDYEVGVTDTEDDRRNPDFP